jgi:phosphorylcholine metabolism protein LicD
MVSNGIVTKTNGKHCLNSVAISVLKIKCIYAESFIKINVYSFQRMVGMHLFYRQANGNNMENKYSTSKIFCNSNFQICILSTYYEISAPRVERKQQMTGNFRKERRAVTWKGDFSDPC